MLGFKICFTHPWLLLLLIPAALLTFVPYFRINKRYRRTRNRIISLVLHSVVMVLVISLLSGFHIKYYEPNKENEMIVLVDVSDTEALSAERRDAFVEGVIGECAYENIRVGVVTFGFDQVYAVPLTYDYEQAFDAYATAFLPDTSATNIVGAMEYAASLFNYPKTGKIVLVTDAKETDGEVITSIAKISSMGISVDAAYLSSSYGASDAQITGIVTPEQHVELGTNCDIVVELRSDNAVEATLKLYDNGALNQAIGEYEVSLQRGDQSVVLKHAFEDEGLHEIRCELQIKESDGVKNNNEYCTYYNLKVYDKILIIESQANTSGALIDLLNADGKYTIPPPVCVTSDSFPKTLDELRAYDQIIMNNIANSDLPEGFDRNLKSYVQDYGGGLFTVGGSDKDGKAHAYNKTDMYGTPYQSILPIQATSYTPPIGVMFVLDGSGSMMATNDYGTTFFDSAKVGAAACVEDLLVERDYVGVMTLDSDYSMVLEMTPATQKSYIKEKIVNIKTTSGNTVFSNAIRMAGETLRALKEVSKRHIVVISDGITESENTYMPYIKDFYASDGITFSVVGVNMTDVSRAAMEKATEAGGGRLYEVNTTKQLIDSMMDDLAVPKVEDVNGETFTPIVYDDTSLLVQGLERGEGVERNRLTVSLGGFYGGRIKEGADLILVGEYEVPVYAQWKFGKGMVGSFMCDAQKIWSKEFMDDENGKTFLRRIVHNLMPMTDIRPNDITVNLMEDNYTNTLSVFPKLKDGETVKGELVQITENGEKSVSLNQVTGKDETATFFVEECLSAANKFSRCKFIVKESGVYEIRLTKYDKDGKQVGNTFVVYKTFAYSKEYDTANEYTEEDLIALLTSITQKSEGEVLTDLEDTAAVLVGFVTKLERVFDPRLSFMILAIVLFLLDIAVCKFKFKWIHEIIRERKMHGKQ